MKEIDTGWNAVKDSKLLTEVVMHVCDTINTDDEWVVVRLADEEGQAEFALCHPLMLSPLLFGAREIGNANLVITKFVTAVQNEDKVALAEAMKAAISFGRRCRDKCDSEIERIEKLEEQDKVMEKERAED